jgi:hypothetical protein
MNCYSLQSEATDSVTKNRDQKCDEMRQILLEEERSCAWVILQVRCETSESIVTEEGCWLRRKHSWKVATSKIVKSFGTVKTIVCVSGFWFATPKSSLDFTFKRRKEFENESKNYYWTNEWISEFRMKKINKSKE